MLTILLILGTIGVGQREIQLPPLTDFTGEWILTDAQAKGSPSVLVLSSNRNIENSIRVERRDAGGTSVEVYMAGENAGEVRSNGEYEYRHASTHDGAIVLTKRIYSGRPWEVDTWSQLEETLTLLRGPVLQVTLTRSDSAGRKSSSRVLYAKRLPG